MNLHLLMPMYMQNQFRKITQKKESGNFSRIKVECTVRRFCKVRNCFSKGEEFLDSRSWAVHLRLPPPGSSSRSSSSCADETSVRIEDEKRRGTGVSCLAHAAHKYHKRHRVSLPSVPDVILMRGRLVSRGIPRDGLVLVVWSSLARWPVGFVLYTKST